MKKILLLFLFVSFGFSSLSAGDNFKADSLKIKQKIDVIMKRYYRSVVKAKTAAQLAAAIDRYTLDFKKLIPEMKALEKKYKNHRQVGGEADHNYNDFDGEMQSMINDEKLAKAMQKHVQFYSHPKVQAAMRRMMLIMSQLDEKNGSNH